MLLKRQNRINGSDPLVIKQGSRVFLLPQIHRYDSPLKFFEGHPKPRNDKGKNMFSKKKFMISLITISSLLFIACSSSPKKGFIPSTANPGEEITKLEIEHGVAMSNNIDVLASKEFQASVKWLEEAKTEQRNKSNQESILDDLRNSRGSLESAYEASQNRAEKAPGLFAARRAALTAGTARFAELKDDLQDLDQDTSAVAPDLERTTAEKISILQDRYLTLERKATILTHLGAAQAQFNGAKKEGAGRQLPSTFKKSELSLKNAESVISANVRNPEGYAAVVSTANADATLLKEAMSVIKQNGKNLSEVTALKMVWQNRKIKALNSDLTDSNAESAANQSKLNKKNQALTAELKDTNQDLESAQSHMETQRAMETARAQFTVEEAEAYQQGPNLLIRMKQMNFASGRAELPQASLQLLAKISNVAKSMRAAGIKIEGHTDSIGSVEQNRVISQDRADAVASYFKSNGFNQVTSQGYGFEKPLATNKSKAGRAQNRRVDIIITPMEPMIQQ